MSENDTNRDDQYDETGRIDPQQDPETRILPTVEAPASYGYSDYPEDEDAPITEDEQIAAMYSQYGQYHWDNLPLASKQGDSHVTRETYDQLYDELIQVIDFHVRLQRDHDNALRQIQILEDDSNDEAQIRAAERNRVERSAIEAERRDLNAREQEVEDEKRKNLITKIALGVLSVILMILCIVFALAWNNARTDRDSVSQGSAAQQEQVQQMKENLDSARKERDQLASENRSLSERADTMNQQITDARKDAENQKSEVSKKDEEIKNLNDRLREVEEAEPETVTETQVREDSGRTVTETQTGTPETVTVTETSGATP